ncbi:MAG: glycoside hydrolase family 16 protein [Herpetosiphonaceae bacterium]|nr:glycoside hydrolase family 16 protein [Herpetosiphonaceae bacterium]
MSYVESVGFLEDFARDLHCSPAFDWYSTSASAQVRANCAEPLALNGRVVRLELSAGHAASPDQGANLKSRQRYLYGTYAARLRAAACSTRQEGVISGFFTYFNDGSDSDASGMADNSEIDIEWLAAEPQSIYLSVWTSYDLATQGSRRVYRKINLASGTIEYTRFGTDFNPATHRDLASEPEASQPAQIPAIASYDASARFYEYGFHWAPQSVTWWIVHPETGQRIVLWHYRGQCIPQIPAYTMVNIWHSNTWAPEAQPQALACPQTRIAAAVDWIEYQPLEPVLAPASSPATTSART